MQLNTCIGFSRFFSEEKRQKEEEMHEKLMKIAYGYRLFAIHHIETCVSEPLKIFETYKTI